MLKSKSKEIKNNWCDKNNEHNQFDDNLEL